MTTGTETERLKFEPLTEEHRPHLIEFFTHPEASKFFQPIENVEAFVDMWFERLELRLKKDGVCFNALINKTSDEFIGQCGPLIQTLDGEEEVFYEVGYHIMPQYWRQGYASEAAKHTRNCIFKSGKTDLVISIIHKDNHPSKGVARKNGMNVLRTATFRGWPVEIFGIKREDWERITAQ